MRVGLTSQLRDAACYRPSGEGSGAALVDLQVHLATSSGHERRHAAALLTQAAYHAFVLATTFGYLQVAQLAAQRAVDAARIAERPELEVSRCAGRRCTTQLCQRMGVRTAWAWVRALLPGMRARGGPVGRPMSLSHERYRAILAGRTPEGETVTLIIIRRPDHWRGPVWLTSA
ncbi:MAG: hypothetical protein M3308_08385, partial [Actinomycetota bacterium]|nr:hypothetical protein [Actinomycetota bacterium]